MNRSKAGRSVRSLRRLGDCLNDNDTLLNAYIPPTAPAPMNEIGRQRRQAMRELLRNIAALDLIQSRRRSLSTLSARGIGAKGDEVKIS